MKKKLPAALRRADRIGAFRPQKYAPIELLTEEAGHLFLPLPADFVREIRARRGDVASLILSRGWVFLCFNRRTKAGWRWLLPNGKSVLGHGPP